MKRLIKTSFFEIISSNNSYEETEIESAKNLFIEQMLELSQTESDLFSLFRILKYTLYTLKIIRKQDDVTIVARKKYI